MCRSIKQLRSPDRSPTDTEIEEAARQFVRKVSGYRVPSRVNEAAFNRAVAEIAAATQRMLNDLTAAAPRSVMKE
jgi:hypothetical protein